MRIMRVNFTGQIDGSYGNGTAVSIYSNEILVGDCA